MFSRQQSLPLPEAFSFPFEPYETQRRMMEALFDVVEKKQIGIFESPTGTGKTLTLTCSILTWLFGHESLVERELNEKIQTLTLSLREAERKVASSADWITEQFEIGQQRQALADLKTQQQLLDANRKRIEEIRRNLRRKSAKKPRFSEPNSGDEEDKGQDEFLLEERASDEDPDEDEESKERFRDIKIFFCSRTHSQLSQVVNEIKRTSFGASVRVISLASRQNYCINPSVKALKSANLINERCLELQKSKSSAKRCPFNHRQDLEALKDRSISEILDIEELVQVGKQEKACPYYVTRLASVDCQVVMLPYQMLLHRKTREQSGIDIRDSVIVIDEAHNLLDTISAIHSAEVSLEQLQSVRGQLEAYKGHYLSRFSQMTVLRLNQLVFIVKGMIRVLQGESRMILTHDLMDEGEFFNLNIFELLKFAEQSRLAHKVHGLSLKLRKEEALKPPKSEGGVKSFLKQLENQAKGKKATEEVQETKENAEIVVPNVIRPFFAFLACLLEDFEDGRILVQKETSLKYLLLNPGSRFNEIIASCRSLILAGGTMEPITEFTEQLFPNCMNRVHVHSFGHVVDRNAVLPLIIPKGPSGATFNFNYEYRANALTLKELSSALLNLCTVVPAGIVTFFVSYDYLDSVYEHLKQSGGLQAIESRKRVFKEPRKAGHVEQMLEEYARTVKQSKGALLLSVVGGKLSEGLNFSDDLGRCVVVVGLPFPNKNSPELKERMTYLDKHLHAAAGAEYYENLCMKAVNQCIGRAVRHIRDYAAVVLLDSRYSGERIRKKLPAWIAQSLQVAESYGRAQAALAKFFREKK